MLMVDIEAREAEIIGKPQRIGSLTADELDNDATELIATIREALHSVSTNKTNKKTSKVFGLMLRHPGVFRCQMDMSIQLLGNGEINPREREIAILRVGWWCRAPYEWGEHVRVAKRYGITTKEIERITLGSSALGWSEHERTIIRGVEELLGDQMISDATWEILAKTWNERQLMEFPVLVGQYFATALQQNSLRIGLDENNIGLRQR